MRDADHVTSGHRVQRAVLGQGPKGVLGRVPTVPEKHGNKRSCGSDFVTRLLRLLARHRRHDPNERPVDYVRLHVQNPVRQQDHDGFV